MKLQLVGCFLTSLLGMVQKAQNSQVSSNKLTHGCLKEQCFCFMWFGRSLNTSAYRVLLRQFNSKEVQSSWFNVLNWQWEPTLSKQKEGPCLIWEQSPLTEGHRENLLVSILILDSQPGIQALLSHSFVIEPPAKGKTPSVSIWTK